MCAYTSSGIIDRIGAQTMLYLTCTMISSVDLVCYGVSHAKDWVSVTCGTNISDNTIKYLFFVDVNLFYHQH